jgi:hypothetical protein
MYQVEVSVDLISRVTDAVARGEWGARRISITPALTIAVKHSVRAGCRAAAGSGAGDARSWRPTG